MIFGVVYTIINLLNMQEDIMDLQTEHILNFSVYQKLNDILEKGLGGDNE